MDKVVFETIKVEREGTDGMVLHVILSRPNKGNSMTNTFWREYRECFQGIARDTSCRAVIVSAMGKHFTVGLDLHDAGISPPNGEDPGRLSLHNRSHVLDLQESFTAMERCPQPVIVAVHGAAIGGGVDMSCAADIRLCSKQAWFCIKEVDVGLAADVGTLQRLHHVLGNASLARELCYTARRFPAEEAMRAGFVSAVYENREELLAKAREMAELIASKSPVAVFGTKVHLNYSREHTIHDSLEYISTWNGAMLQASDVLVAITAAFNKKGGPPKFSKL